MNIQARPAAPPATPSPALRLPPIWLLVGMTGLGPFTMQIMVPSLPGIARALEAPVASVQLTVTLYLAAVAAGQLFYGPLSDRFGRRPLLMGGLAVFTVASLAAAAAPSLGWLIAARVAQALGTCAGMVLARAVIRDCWPRDQSASVLGYVTMGMTVAPMVAPILGSLLEEYVGWRASMLACLAFGIPLAAAAFLRLPETLPAPQPLPGLRSIGRAYASLFALPGFRAMVGVTAFSTGVFFAFLGGAPYVVVEGMGHSPSTFAIAFAAMSVLFALGNFLAGRLSARLGVTRMLSIGTGITTLGAVLALAAVVALPPNLLLFFAPMGIVAIGNGITQPNAIAGALSARPELAGTASALAGALQMGFGALMTLLVGLTETGSGIGTTVTMACAGLGTHLALRAARRAG
ncbi:MAG TPA: multidrug effflux MFS transporter [Acetobacteraceae bacterium]|nr:multidrug effflux MFS transporter [Acetobacteraceae bacterium]